MSYLLDHTVLFDGLFLNGHFNWLHAAFVVAALAIIFYCWKKIKNMKREKDELEQQLSSKVADVTTGFTPRKTEACPVSPTET